jgi:hypothetical protein
MDSLPIPHTAAAEEHRKRHTFMPSPQDADQSMQPLTQDLGPVAFGGQGLAVPAKTIRHREGLSLKRTCKDEKRHGDDTCAQLLWRPFKPIKPVKLFGLFARSP